MSAPLPNLDSVFRALGNPTRRSVIEHLSRGNSSATDLAMPFGMALPSFIQHMDILEAAGLVASRKFGRRRIYELRQQNLRTAIGWLETQRSIWTRRLDQLDAFLIATKDKKP